MIELNNKMNNQNFKLTLIKFSKFTILIVLRVVRLTINVIFNFIEEVGKSLLNLIKNYLADELTNQKNYYKLKILTTIIVLFKISKLTLSKLKIASHSKKPSKQVKFTLDEKLTGNLNINSSHNKNSFKRFKSAPPTF